MQTEVEGIEVIDRNGDGSETRMMLIRDRYGELKSHLLRRLLRDGQVVKVPRKLAWELADEIKRLAIACDESPFPEGALAGRLAYLADHEEAEPGPVVLVELLDRRSALCEKYHELTGWTQEDAWQKVYAMREGLEQKPQPKRAKRRKR